MPENEFIYFRRIDIEKRKTPIFEIVSKSSGVTLGDIRWYAPWRQYCFFPGVSSVFNIGCLKTINEMIEFLMEERRTDR